MEIRVKATGEVMFEHEFRAQHPNVSGPLDALYDVVFEGPQATGGTIYQYSQRDGVEEIDGQWFTKYVLGPVFSGETAAADEAAYIAMKDAEFKAANADRAKQELLATDWSELPTVRDAAVTPHLTNAADFDAYRVALRAIAIDPPVTVATWPTRPDATWST